MKKIERKKDLQIGHCYRTTQDYFKVDSIVNGEPYGSTYDIYEPTPVVVTHYPLSLYVEEIGCIEISEEEYEETLQRMIINNQDTTQIDETTFIKNKRTGEISHEMNFTRMDSKGMYLRNNLAFLLGDVEVFQVDTYRYIFPLCKRFRYNKPSQPYPAYNRGVTPFEWQRNRKLIKERLIKFISELE